ncbi:Uncharacterized protein TPAR_00065 [Tolypocladium paradoxum]|uniref:Uncharacterized protein n=1 Tax=Tolypocladium paradoxum TaxID=94208 RepID=A0A2S4LBE1_9HYPO|nr:Uncharacterized protein TPAR_00065 [Tolypocladium paradoxum]
MATNTAEYHILQHPTNYIHETKYTSSSNKSWARQYKPIAKVVTRSYIDREGKSHANFEEAFLPLYDDDMVRMQESCVGPNTRLWRFAVEADCENWFHTEISNVVLAAWARYPAIWQTSHSKPFTETSVSENVDVAYSVKIGGIRYTIAIGEIKRNLIDLEDWQSGSISSTGTQMRLSKELRGYAHKYQCPQVFCFDGAALLLLQFRASKLERIEDENCQVDCWVIPRTGSYCTLRYGLYRLLAQGWRRCQSETAGQLTVGGLTADSREFYNGRPIWRVDGVKHGKHPAGYERSVDGATGALKWTNEEYPEVMETWPFWGGEAAQSEF